MSERSPPPSLWAALAAATVLNLPLGSLYAFSVFLKPLEELLGVSRSELAFVFALATIGFTVGMNLAPRLFAVASPAMLVGLCAAGTAGGIALAGLATGLWQLALGYGVLFGICGGLAYIVVQQGVNMVVAGSRAGLVNGYIVSLYPLGAMVAAPLFGWAIVAFGVRPTLLGLAVTLAVTGVTALVLVVIGRVPLSQAGGEAATLPPVSGQRRVFWLMFGIFLVAAAAGLMVLSQAAGIVAAYGGASRMALISTTVITGAIAAARLAGGWLVDRFSPPMVMAGAQLLALTGAVGLSLWPTAEVSAAGLCAIGMGYGIISGSTAGTIPRYWPKAAFGLIASRLYIAWCIAAVSLPVLAGYLYDLTGGYRTAVIVAGAGNLVGVLLALLLPRTRPEANT